ncbi:hypothetical protein [Clostridium sp. UBA7503]|uniref:hypothetical protein n=1 Tax=Clostridium sp. UBA7503 TaxID=1946377 RepID=UPI003217D4FA
MKIALISGSPKIKNSASDYILQELKAFLRQQDNMIIEYYFREPQLSIKEIENLVECDTLVFAFPLYVDGISSHLLNGLVKLEKTFQGINKEIKGNGLKRKDLFLRK